MKPCIQITTHRRPAIRPCTQSLAGPGAAPGPGKVRGVLSECGASHRARNGRRDVIRAILAGMAAQQQMGSRVPTARVAVQPNDSRMQPKAAAWSAYIRSTHECCQPAEKRCGDSHSDRNIGRI